MSNPIYSYSSIYGGSGASSLYSHRGGAAVSNSLYLSDGGGDDGPSRLPSVDPFPTSDLPSFYSERASSLYTKQGIGAAGSYSTNSIAGGIGGATGSSSLYVFDPSLITGAKRSTEALYHPTVIGSHNNIGQTEALYASNSLIKRPRVEVGSNLPIYPQRPGEKDCAYYMMTRTCKFGDACKFDHPIWVPEGGLPDWKEVPLVPSSESLPERPGDPDCPYYMKTQKCKFGPRCKFNHPKAILNASAGGSAQGDVTENSLLPERPSEPICAFYAKTGKCKFSASCKFHHPKNLQVLSNDQDIVNAGKSESAENDNGTPDGDSRTIKSFVPFTPALLHNSKGLPIRPGEIDCPFYLKTGSCKYGPNCRYNHPDRNSINPPLVAGLAQAIIPSPAANLPIGIINPAASLLQNIDLRAVHSSLGVATAIYPQRPGEIECDFYMKTGQCKFEERCKFHHPIDRSSTNAVVKQTPQLTVKLTLAGLPRREGAVICTFYMKTGTCKFGAACKFDHPPPGEAIALAAIQGIGNIGGEGGEDKIAGTK